MHLSQPLTFKFKMFPIYILFIISKYLGLQSQCQELHLKICYPIPLSIRRLSHRISFLSISERCFVNDSLCRNKVQHIFSFFKKCHLLCEISQLLKSDEQGAHAYNFTFCIEPLNRLFCIGGYLLYPLFISLRSSFRAYVVCLPSLSQNTKSIQLQMIKRGNMHVSKNPLQIFPLGNKDFKACQLYFISTTISVPFYIRKPMI